MHGCFPGSAWFDTRGISGEQKIAQSERRSGMWRRISLLLALAAVALVSVAHAQNRPFDPVGTWKSYHKDGTSFDLRLYPDGSARSTADGGQLGSWTWDGETVRIVFNDGWDDVLEAGEGGQMVKKSWGPGVDRSQPSKNVSRVELLSRDPSGGG